MDDGNFDEMKSHDRDMERAFNSPGRQIDFYEALVDAQGDMGEGVCVYDSHTRRFIYVNDTICKMFGYSKEELFNMHSLFDLVAPECRPMQQAKASLRLSEIHVTEIQETIGLRKDGSRFHLEYSTRRIEGDETKLVGLSRDISRRKKMEEATHHAYSVLDDLFNKAPCGFHSVDASGYFVKVNETLANWLGYSKEEMTSRTLKTFDIMAPEDVALGHKTFDELLRTGKSRTIQISLKRKDGSTFPVLFKTTVQKDTEGRFLFTRTTTFDLTDQKKAEERARSNDDLYQLFLNELTDLCVAMLDTKGVIVVWSKGAENITGRNQSEVIGQSFADLVPNTAENKEMVKRDLKTVVSAGQLEIGGWWDRKDGSQFWGRGILSTAKNAAGQIMGYWLIFRDVTAEKRLDESLQKVQQLQWVKQSPSPNIVVLIGPDQKIIFTGPTFQSVTGLDENDTNGKLFSDIFYPEDRKFACQMIGRAFVGKRVPRFGARLRQKSGAYATVEILARPLFRDGELYVVPIIARTTRPNDSH